MKVQLAAVLEPSTIDFYRDVMEKLNRANVPFLVGGAFAFGRYTGINRATKDFDIFLKRSDMERAFEVLEAAGYRSEFTFPHWLGKAWNGDDFVDLIFGAGNSVALVDDRWFEHAVEGVVFDTDVKLCPAEEMIWSKGFIMERERFDGADIAHLIYALNEKLDWKRLVERFGDNWRVLFAHVVLFGFIYPGFRHLIPKWLLDDYSQRLKRETERPSADEMNVCRGTVISRGQYLIDLDRGFEDGRLEPRGNMSQKDIDFWTDAIGKID